MLSENHGLSSDELQTIFQLLTDNNIIKLVPQIAHQLSDRELMKFDRQIRSFAALKHNNIADAIKFQEKIKRSHIAILGIGGVGSYVAYGLTTMGIGGLTLIDFDHIELSNTSRQMLYTESDIGKRKIDVAKKKLIAVNPIVEIKTIPKRITQPTDLEPHLKDVDILILCADTPRGKIVYIVDEACQTKKCPFLFGIPSYNQIICGPLIIPGRTRTYAEIFPNTNVLEKANLSHDTSEKINYLNAGFVATIIDPYNAIAAKLVTLEAVKFLTGFSQCQLINQVLNFDTNTLISSITKV